MQPALEDFLGRSTTLLRRSSFAQVHTQTHAAAAGDPMVGVEIAPDLKWEAATEQQKLIWIWWMLTGVEGSTTFSQTLQEK